MKNAAKCDTQCELQNPRVIRSLNANCAEQTPVRHVCFSVFVAITNLNAIEVVFTMVSLVKKEALGFPSSL
jgi:hypothetical protein